jgi:hypothetical protein
MKPKLAIFFLKLGFMNHRLDDGIAALWHLPQNEQRFRR